MTVALTADQIYLGGLKLAAIYALPPVTLTNAQIKALPTTPITLIAAPGVGYRIKLQSGSLRLDTTAGAYASINPVFFMVTLGPGANALWVNDNSLTTPLTQGTDAFTIAAAHLLDVMAPQSYAYDEGATSGVGEWVLTEPLLVADVDNLPLQISIENSGAVLTSGHATNTLLVNVAYTIEAV